MRLRLRDRESVEWSRCSHVEERGVDSTKHPFGDVGSVGLSLANASFNERGTLRQLLIVSSRGPSSRLGGQLARYEATPERPRDGEGFLQRSPTAAPSPKR